ncbi:MAG: septum formation initiator family protein [Myxococcales bacterium]|nr:septum formation initiator family protein [Myxococcales bacterium]MCB9644295.1 septum formation initiator family protein [Myxococcales bacterium]
MMVGVRALFLLSCLALTAAYGWWVTHPMGAQRHYKQLRAQITKQEQKNHQARKENDVLRRKIMALRYDQRAAEQAARDHLFLAKPNEVVVICPK